MFGMKLSESKVVQILERRIESLEKRENKLLDRLMARNYGEFVLGQNVLDEKREEATVYPESALDESAGEVLETDE